MASLSEEERAELDARSSMIAFYRRTVELLQSERNLLLRDLLIAKGLDPEREYAMDPKTGELTEAPDG